MKRSEMVQILKEAIISDMSIDFQVAMEYQEVSAILQKLEDSGMLPPAKESVLMGMRIEDLTPIWDEEG
jgi:hypothetical protein